jgi:RNA recognition motif-containing protein
MFIFNSKGWSMKIYTGNLSLEVTEEDLRREFKEFGQVTFVNLVKDRFGKTSQGFGYLGMPVQSEAEAAIVGLNGKEFKGKTLVVEEIRPRPLNGTR